MPAAPSPRPLRIAALAHLAGSVKLRLAVGGALLVVVSVATTMGLMLHETRSRTEQRVMVSELEQARRLARVLSSDFVEMQLLLRRSTDDLSEAPQADPVAMAAPVVRKLTGSFDTVFVADVDGHVLAWQDELGLQRLPDRVGDAAWFEASVRHHRPVISSVQWSRGDSDPIIVLTMPVLERGSGRVLMVLGGALRLKGERLLGNFSNFEAEDATTGVTVVMDADGKVVSHPDGALLMMAADADPHLRAAIAKWIDKGRPVDPLGTEVWLPGHIAAFAGVPVADWIVLRLLDKQDVMEALHSGRDRAVVAGGLVALVGGAVLFALTMLLLRPLRSLEQRAERLLEHAPLSQNDMPSELLPLVDALNQYNSRMQSMLLARRRFFDDAAHQLKTPLAVMQVQAELALRERGVEAVHEQIAALLKTLEGVTHAVRGLLSLARLEPDSGRQYLLQERDLGELAREVALDFAPLARARLVDIEFDASRPAPALLEPNLVPELIGNLIDNALRHGGSTCKVHVAVIGPATTVLSIEDDGPGIPLHERENVFKRFYRIAGTPADGSGLGLAIVSEIARVHGADVSLCRPDSGGLRVQVAFRRSAATQSTSVC